MIFQHRKILLKVAEYFLHTVIIGTLANLPNVTINVNMFIVCRHRTILFPLDGFSLNLIFEGFSKICGEKFKFYWNMTSITDVLHEDICTFIIMFLRMKNILNKTFRENQNTFCAENFPEIVIFIGQFRKVSQSRISSRLHYNTAHALCMPDK